MAMETVQMLRATRTEKASRFYLLYGVHRQAVLPVMPRFPIQAEAIRNILKRQIIIKPYVVTAMRVLYRQ